MEVKEGAGQAVAVSDAELAACVPGLPAGPLDAFRGQASFDWRRMKLAYDSIQSIKAKNKIWSFMEAHPLFKHAEETPPLDEQRHIATKRMYVIHNEDLVPIEEIAEHPRLFQSFTEAVFMFDSSLAIKLSLTFRMFANTIRGSGRDHHFPLVQACEEGSIGGCFALTEIAHGSNAKGMRTTATYDPARRCFELHTPDFQAAKCWVGSLGKCATHAVVYARLVSLGRDHGLHAFVVPVRDPRTLRALPGVTVGDLGEKIGLNGVDNGFVMFDHYRVPREAALDRLGGVDEAGEYRSPLRDPAKRFGASLGILSGGRVAITAISTNYLQKGVVIATRYSAVRRQFGPPGAPEETPVLHYQQQQVRLLPYLAATFAQRVFCNWFGELHVRVTIDSLMGADGEAAARGVELHALSSAVKPVCGWAARDGLQACRECCGGHGYLKAAGIGELRNDNDANCTYEGENSVLLQQASNWLLTLWARRDTPGVADTPLGSVRFLAGADRLLAEQCPWTTQEEMVQPANVVRMYAWLTAWLLRRTASKAAALRGAGRSPLQARNDSQAYTAVALAVAYGELVREERCRWALTVPCCRRGAHVRVADGVAAAAHGEQGGGAARRGPLAAAGAQRLAGLHRRRARRRLRGDVVRMYAWLTAWLLRRTASKAAALRGAGRSPLQARNDSQAYTAVALAVAYGEHFILRHFYESALAFADAACRGVLLRLAALYGAFMLEKHMATLYIGGYFSKEQGLLLREGVLSLCEALGPEAAALADTLAPPDWCLQSVLGAADGEVYKRLQAGVLGAPGALARPAWWRDVVHWESYARAHAKL